MMKTQPDSHSLNLEPTMPAAPILDHKNQVVVTAALLLIATGIVFSLIYAGKIGWADPWWVTYIAIPSLMLLFNAGSGLIQGDGGKSAIAGSAILGLLGIVVSIIMVVDPTWSFTQTWRLDETFPFLRSVGWNPVWQWLLVILGVAGLVAAIVRQSVWLGAFGVILMMVGGIFLLNLAWDSVWPVFLVILGIGLLLQIVRK